MDGSMSDRFADLEVLTDALREGRRDAVVLQMIADLWESTAPEHRRSSDSDDWYRCGSIAYSTLADGCEGDRAGLEAALGTGYIVLAEHGYDGGWGHHGYDMIAVTADGKLISAHCGGCSCDGSGGWQYVDELDEALRLVPENNR